MSTRPLVKLAPLPLATTSKLHCRVDAKLGFAILPPFKMELQPPQAGQGECAPSVLPPPDKLLAYASHLPASFTTVLPPLNDMQNKRQRTNIDIRPALERRIIYHCAPPLNDKRNKRQRTNSGKRTPPEKRKILHCSYTNCSKSFGHRGHLNRHIESVHRRLRKHKCHFPSCDAAFFQASHLHAHVTHVHSIMKRRKMMSNVHQVMGARSEVMGAGQEKRMILINELKRQGNA